MQANHSNQPGHPPFTDGAQRQPVRTGKKLPLTGWTEAMWQLALRPGISLRGFRRTSQPALRKLSSLLTCCLFLLAVTASAAVKEVGSIGLTVDNLARETKFFSEVLQFQAVNESEREEGDLGALTGIPDAKIRTVTLGLGDERITLTEWDKPKGKLIPSDSRSFDHWFQHIAIVVSDMDRAYEHLQQHKVRHVSTLPQTLPAWNKNAAGIKAFYFQDPEGHVLEIIWFPPGKGDPKWQGQKDRLFLGIDHTAIVVSDTDRSLAFYRDALGMKVAGASENYGAEQEHLNQVFGARLRITALRAAKGPGIEFLEYITPPGGRPLPEGSRPNDLIFWHTHLVLDETSISPVKLMNQGAVSISAKTGDEKIRSGASSLLRDPDGHGLQLRHTRRNQASR